jgi:hypothetical protein
VILIAIQEHRQFNTYTICLPWGKEKDKSFSSNFDFIWNRNILPRIPTINRLINCGCIHRFNHINCDHNSFSKWVLGWLTPIVIANGNQNITLNPSGTSKDAVIMMPESG